MTHACRWAAIAAIVMAALACGPELTTPSSTNISGTWTSSDIAAGVTDFVLVLSQASDGALTGSWSGRALEVNGACPAELGCAPANNIVGSNTVLQVYVDLIGLGAFTGQTESDVHFRGHLAGAALAFNRVAEIQGARLSGGVANLRR
ncbi:MAG: hypothetical protein NUV34_09390 [Sulfuricaulis sp.]|nr:hypothetical protein [Sulfuricaulis sp.]